MRILPISSLNIRRSPTENRNDYRSYTALGQDCVSFSAKPMSAKNFKKLSQHMVCLYTAEPMLTDNALRRMKAEKLFQGSIKDVLKKLEPYVEKYWEPDRKYSPIELEVIDMLKKADPYSKEQDLSTYFKTMYIQTRAKFRKEQRPYFNFIKIQGAQLPEEYLEKFYEFMQITDRKLYDEPIVRKFSLKEFNHDVMKILDKSTDTNFKNRIGKFMDMLNDECFENNDKPVLTKIVKKVSDFVNLKINGKKSAYYQKHLKYLEQDKDLVRIKIIEKIHDAAVECGYRKLERVCNNNILMLRKIPVRIPFSNKAFVYDLEKVLDGMPNETLKDEILRTARNLPSSAGSPEALILKFADADNDIIGDRLFNPQLASIEHMKAHSKEGEDTMQNCALAKRWINTLRGNIDLWITLRNFPIKNQQKYARHLVKLYNLGHITKEDTLGHLRTIEIEGRINLQPFIDYVETGAKLPKKLGM